MPSEQTTVSVFGTCSACVNWRRADATNGYDCGIGDVVPYPLIVRGITRTLRRSSPSMIRYSWRVRPRGVVCDGSATGRCRLRLAALTLLAIPHLGYTHSAI
jgi:hypothetical protein